ncbi:STN domain-containing protein, partial [Shinella sp.]|uniref:STN domain-containing protein n=1 Tax=Shinella sp. TaxID=1870904 RepID=UPI0039E544A7
MAKAGGIDKRHGSRTARWALLASTVLASVAMTPAEAVAQQKTSRVSMETSGVAFSIPAQPLPDALDAFIRATGWQVGYSTRITDGRRSTAVVGTMPPAQA